ncbi:MAG: hypothetical protein ACXAC6_09785 [Candidatus Hodarchaeales archaeon]|jgi:hypothetical protein
MRQQSNADKEIWGEKGELLSYLKDAKAMMKKDQKRNILEES